MNTRNRSDYWTLLAKKQGYPARSVFKLEEIQKKWHVIRKNSSLLDIGASPGSWSLFALRLKANVAVTAIDLKPLSIQAPPGTQLRFFQGDVFCEEAAAFLQAGEPFGCILSDAAPATSGNRLVDVRKSWDLVMHIIDLAQEQQSQGGNLVVKVFQGGDEREILNRLKKLYKTVKVFTPQAVRKHSMEVYMIGLNFFG